MWNEVEKLLDTSLENILFAFSLTLFAGLSTSVGGLLAFFPKKMTEKFLSMSLGFSAGVMIYLSFIEILVGAEESLIEVYSEQQGRFITMLSFFGGMLLIFLISHFITIEPKKSKETKLSSKDQIRDDLMRTGLLSALAIAIHNFPEGITTFIVALNDRTLGIGMAIAIAIHNIPEGIAVSVPIYYATKSKKKAFMYSFISGLAEPLGAIVGFLFLLPILTPTLLGIIYAMIAGIMIYISFEELIPTAMKYGGSQTVTIGIIAGMFIMALSLVLL